MKLLIDNVQLQLLLEKKREDIGHKVNGIDTFFAGISFLLSILCADFHDIAVLSGESIKTFSFIIGIFFTFRGVYMVVKSIKKQYGHEEMYKDIEKLNEIQYRHSLVAIQDTFNEHSNRYLLYYDERWDCKFFFNYKTVDNDEENIRNRLSSELKIDKSCIQMEFKTEQIQEKYSVSHDEKRIYDHRVYYANITSFNEVTRNDEFEIDGKKFFWMTIQEMQQDQRIKEINEDVVDLVKSVSI